MARASAVDKLSPEHKRMLDDKLFDNGFNGYFELEKWLRELGYEISKSAIHRYGQKMERKLNATKIATEMAIHFAENVGDDTGALSSATLGILQTEMFNAIVALKDLEGADESDEPIDPEKRLLMLGKISRSISEVAKANIAQKKWEMEVREKVKAELIAEQQAKLDELNKQGDISKDVLKTLVRELYNLEV